MSAAAFCMVLISCVSWVDADGGSAVFGSPFCMSLLICSWYCCRIWSCLSLLWSYVRLFFVCFCGGYEGCDFRVVITNLWSDSVSVPAYDLESVRLCLML